MSISDVEDSPAIEKLPSSTVSQIRSTLNITSLSDVLRELIQNALDSKAQQLDCWINLERWGVRVSDNGRGIGRDGIRAIAERYGMNLVPHLNTGSQPSMVYFALNPATSKASDIPSLSNLSTFGFRGEALASIAAMSLVEVVSKREGEVQAYSKVIKGGEVLSCGPSNRYHRSTPGTTVTVKDLFFNIPVRRPPTAFTDDPFSSSSSLHPSPPTIIAHCRKIVEIAALSFPEVSVTLSLEEDGGIDGVKRLMTIGKSTSALGTFRVLFGKALVKSVKEIHVSYKNMRIDGFVSFNGAHTKGYQYLYVNKFNLNRCELHKVIDQGFTRSNWAALMAAEEDEEEDSPARVRRSPRHAILKPVYVLNITVSPREVDMILEPGKKTVGFEDWDAVGKFLTAAIDEVLRQQGYLDPATHTQSRKTPSPIEQSPPKSVLFPRERQRSLLVPDYGGGEPARPLSGLGSRLPQALVPPEKRPTSCPCDASTAANHFGTAGDSAPMPEWIRNSLASRQQTVFTPSAQLVPRARPLDNAGVPSHQSQQRRDFADLSHETPTSATSFTRSDLAGAQVIAQVDGKFICCTLPSGGEAAVVVMIDQHAASERIRVEGLLKDLCEGFVTDNVALYDLQPDPHLVLLTTHEVSFLRSQNELCLRILARWGISITLPPPTNDTSEELEQIEVLTVPDVVSRRMGGESGKEAKRVVETYIAYLRQEGMEGLELLMRRGGDAGDWRSVMRWIPRRLVELINSKACRGAIMFNDRLTPTQCTTLISDLSRTDFPFLCAHGRPSIAPLIRVAVGAGGGEGGRGEGIDWGKVRV